VSLNIANTLAAIPHQSRRLARQMRRRISV